MNTSPFPLRRVRTATLDVAFEEHGPAAGEAVVLLHGFPYDPRSYDDVAPRLAADGMRVVVPYLRGYGATRFLSADAMRSGEQAALGADLLDLLDALAIPRASLIGFDWGGRAACVVAALRPERVRALITCGGYAIQDVAGAARPQAPEAELRLWYQYYFATQRGRDGLAAHRRDLGLLLWRLWSPSWSFDEATYDRTAASFENPDFVEVVIHSYRHRFGSVPGDPAVAAMEEALAKRPPIGVPAVALHGADDGVAPPPPEDKHAALFTARYERRVLPGVGHNVPREAPDAVAAALRELLRG